MTRDEARERNRARFPLAAEMLDALEAAGIPATVMYAENAQGEKVGRRDPGPFAEVSMAGRWP